jgi:lipid II:glycine glycyltransferase (peptidoglycan interpeptide bridge formation enzyme)
VTLEPLTSKDEVIAFLAKPELRPYAEFFQTWEWGEYQKARGAPIHRLGAWVDGELVATIMVFLEGDRFGPYLYCPRGPAMDWSNVLRATHVLKAVRDRARELEPKAICLRCDPPLVYGSPDTVPFRTLGFRSAGRFVQIDRTWMADLQPSWDEQLEWQKEHGMRSNVPRYLRRAEHDGVVVRASAERKDLETFLRILHATSERKDGMWHNPIEWYRLQFQLLAPSGMQRVFIAEHEGEAVVAALVAIYGKEAGYLWGGSLDHKRDLRAPHYMHFKIMRYAQEHGCDRYNFWGVVKQENMRPDYHGYGYSAFKRTFGGYELLYQRTQDYIYKPLCYLPTYLNDRRRERISQTV